MGIPSLSTTGLLVVMLPKVAWDGEGVVVVAGRQTVLQPLVGPVVGVIGPHLWDAVCLFTVS